MFARTLGSLTILLACGACGSSSSAPSGGVEDANGLVTSANGKLGPNSKVLDAPSLDVLASVGETELVFTSPTAQLEQLTTDDIVLAGVTARTRGGLVAKVLGVEHRVDAFVIRTRPARLEEAFETLSIKAKGHLAVPAAPPADADDTSPKTLGRIQQGLGLSYPYRLEASSDGGRVTLQGSLGLDASVGVDLDVDIVAFEVRTAALTFDASESFSADLSATGNAAIDEARELARIGFAPITIPVPGLPIPVVLTPRVVVEARLSGNAKGALRANVQHDAGFSSSLGFRDGRIGGTFDPDAKFHVDQPVYDGSLSLRATAEARLEVLVYDTFGPYAGIESYLELGATLEGPPPCTTGVLDAGFAAKVGIRNAFGGDSATRPFDKKYELAKVDTCNADPNAPRPVPTWARSYGRDGSTGDEARAIFEASDGTVLVGGMSGSFAGITAANAGIWLMRLDALGNVLWQRAYSDLPVFGAVRGIVQSAYGFVVAGENGLFEIDPGGNVVWARSVLDDGARIASIDARDDGTLLVAGETTLDASAWAMLADAKGTPIWSRRYAGDTFARVRRARDGGAVLAGRYRTNNGDYYVVKLDVDGNVVWQRAVDNRMVNDENGLVEWGIDRAYDVAEKPDGGVIAVGTSLGTYRFPDANGTAYFYPGVVELGADGSLRGGRVYRAPPGSESMSAKGIGLRPDGTPLIVSSLAAKITDLFEREASSSSADKPSRGSMAERTTRSTTEG